MEFKYHIGYKTTNLVNGKVYYGIHSTNKEPGTDSYIGSGTALKAAIRKYGKEKFKCEILKVFETRTEASEWERDILTEILINDPNCYNLKSGGDSRELEGTGYFSDETLQKMSESHKGKPRDPEWTRKAMETRRKNGNTGVSEAVRQMRRERMLGSHPSPESVRKSVETRRKNGWASSRPEVIAKIKATKLKNGTLGYQSKGRIHIVKGDQEKIIKPEQLSEYEQQGWVKGRRQQTVDKIAAKNKGRESKLKGKPRPQEVLSKIRATKKSRKDQYTSKAGRKRFRSKDGNQQWFMPDQFQQALIDGWQPLLPLPEQVEAEGQELVARFLREVDQHSIPEKQGQMSGKCLFIKDRVRKFFNPRDFKQILNEGWWPVRPAQIFWW